MNRTLPALAAVTLLGLSGAAGAQSLARYAPSGALLALEVNDLAGARRTANTFIERFTRGGLLGDLFSEAGASRSDLELLNGLSGFLDREGLVSFSLGRSFEPHYLLAARPSRASVPAVRRLLAERLRDARASGQRVRKLRAGGFLFYSLVSADGRTPGDAFGFEGGLAYAADSVYTLGGLLRRIGGSREANLAGSRAYRSAMTPLGPGTLRLFADVKSAADLLGPILVGGAQVLPELRNVRLAPFVNAVATLGRIGSSLRVTPAGLETASVLAPSATSGDPALAALLAPAPDPTAPALRAADVLPGGAVAFSSGRSDLAAFYTYVSSLADRSGLRSGGINRDVTAALGLDPKRQVFPWLGTEFASASYKPIANSELLPGVSIDESLFLVEVKDRQAARAALNVAAARLAAGLGDLNALGASSLNLFGAGLPTGPAALAPAPGTKLPPASTVTVAGTSVTRYPLGSGASLVTAFKGDFLILATSDNAMLIALRGGARLSQSGNYRAALTRVPAASRGLGFGYSDASRPVRLLGNLFGETLSPILGLTGEDIGSEEDAALRELSNLFTFTANRLGTAVNWSEATPGGLVSRSFQPVRW